MTVMRLFFLVAILAVFGVAAVINWRRSHIGHEAQLAAERERAQAQSRELGTGGC